MANQRPAWKTTAQPSSPHHRHQSSPEQVIDMSAMQEPLGETERTAARDTFYRIVQHFAHADPYNTTSNATRHTLYSQPRLVQYTYEFALSVESKDVFLRSFFSSLALDLAVADANLDFEELAPLFSEFAEYLMDNFFLPLKASTRKTPQPSPAVHSAVLRAQGATGTAEAYIGTEERLATMRAQCLERDRHRCVISRKFDIHEVELRMELHSNDARDDSGIPFSEQDDIEYDNLEVAHILPHSLMKTGKNAAMDKSRQAALAVLNMFDLGVVHFINGVDIDRPRNGLTLTPLMHSSFGSFRVYFDAVDGQDNTYHIRSLKTITERTRRLPVTRTLFVTEDRTIDPPSARLLAVHRAIAHILHLSGAGEYIDWIFRDMEDRAVRADGSSALGRLVSLGLGGWMDGAVC